MKEKSAHRLLVFVPPHRALAAKAQAATLTSATVVNYVSFGANGEAQFGETPIALLPKAASADLVFDCADVFIAAIDAPKLSDAKLRQALPNLLEDRLLSEPEDCHFAYTVLPKSGTTTVAAQPKLPVSVIDRGWLTRALDAIAESGLRPRAAYSEIYALSAPAAGTLSVRVDRGHGIARTGKHDGFAFDFDGANVPPALLLAVRQLGIKRIAAFGRDGGKLAAMAATLGVQIDDTQRSADLSATDSGVNLLQGAFAQGGFGGGIGLPKFSSAAVKAPLIWLGLAAGVFIAGMNVYHLTLTNESKSLRKQAENAFRNAFPQYSSVSGDIGIMARTAEQEMNKARSRAGIASPTDFSVLNAQAAQLLVGAPLGSIAGVDYRDGILRIKFKQGQADDQNWRSVLRAQAVTQGLSLSFDTDGAARLTAGSIAGSTTGSTNASGVR